MLASSLFSATLANAYPAASDKSAYPEFSWDKPARAIIFRNSARTSDQDVTNIAGHYQVVVMEKSSMEGFTYCEDGIKDLSTRLKAENADITNLFYWNTYRRWGNYFANIEFDQNPSWIWTIDQIGSTVFDQWNAGCQQWWLDTALGMANYADIDGLFLDMLHLHLGSTVGSFYSGDMYANGVALHPKAEMVQDLRNQMPTSSLLTGNGPIHESFASGNSNGYFNVMEGGYIEGWDAADPDDTVDWIEKMHTALLNGKVVLMRSGPSKTEAITGDSKPTNGVEADIHDWMERNAEFPLAVFLMAAQPYSYLMYSEHAAASSAYEWESSYVSHFDNELGFPLEEYTKNGYVYTRAFQFADVSVNIETAATTITWYDASSSNGSGIYQAEYAVNNHATRKTDSAAQLGAYIDGESGFNLTFDIKATAGAAQLDFRVKVPSGTRQMGVFVNGTRVGTVYTASTSWITKTVNANLVDGNNVIELRDTDGTLELDVDYLEVHSTGDGIYQAENDSDLSGCTIQSSNSGYTGSGFVDMGGAGSWFEWHTVNASSGDKNLKFRYASNNDRLCNISVNGTVIGQINFLATGNWTTWSEASIKVPLSSGFNTVRVTAATSAGGPNVDQMTVGHIAIVEASADAHTRGGNYANTNYGSAATLEIKDAPALNYSRQSFLQFAVSDYADADIVNLIISPSSLQNTTGTLQIYQITDDNWTESGLTWNNQPSSGTLIQAFTVYNSDIDQELSVDVTSYIKSQASGDGTASFLLTQPANNDNLIGIHSTESTGSGPYLEIR